MGTSGGQVSDQSEVFAEEVRIQFPQQTGQGSSMPMKTPRKEPLLVFLRWALSKGTEKRFEIPGSSAPLSPSCNREFSGARRALRNNASRLHA
jgi:hypothetical protein